MHRAVDGLDESARVETHVKLLISSFRNLVQAARISPEPGAPFGEPTGGERSTSSYQPSMAIDLNVESIVRSVETLLCIVDQAKRKSILQDFASRNALIEQRERQITETEKLAAPVFQTVADECSALSQEIQEELRRL